jgi:hypothetical protein
MQRGQVDTITSDVHTWREVSLDDTDDISVTEGNKDTKFYQSGRASLSNNTEIFQKGASVSGTVEAMSGNGISKQFAKEISHRLTELKINLEKKLTKGIKDDGTATPFVRRMQGLESWVYADNIVKAATPTEADIQATIKKLWDRNGSGAYVALVNATIKSQIDEIYKNSYHYVAKENEFGLVVNRVITSFGYIDLLLTPHASVDKMTVFDVNDVEIKWLRNPHFQALGRTGDSTDGYVIAEPTLYVASPRKIAQLVIKK